MCVAVPGKIIKINGKTAKVDMLGNIYEANISLITPKIGDYVLIHAGVALEILQKDIAEEMVSLFNELEEQTNEDFEKHNR